MIVIHLANIIQTESRHLIELIALGSSTLYGIGKPPLTNLVNLHIYLPKGFEVGGHCRYIFYSSQRAFFSSNYQLGKSKSRMLKGGGG